MTWNRTSSLISSNLFDTFFWLIMPFWGFFMNNFVYFLREMLYRTWEWLNLPNQVILSWVKIEILAIMSPDFIKHRIFVLFKLRSSVSHKNQPARRTSSTLNGTFKTWLYLKSTCLLKMLLNWALELHPAAFLSLLTHNLKSTTVIIFLVPWYV